MLSIDLELLCDNCGNTLEATCEYLVTGGGKVKLEITPCTSCMSSERESGYSEGYEDGYDKGYDTAEEDNDV